MSLPGCQPTFGDHHDHCSTTKHTILVPFFLCVYRLGLSNRLHHHDSLCPQRMIKIQLCQEALKITLSYTLIRSLWSRYCFLQLVESFCSVKKHLSITSWRAYQTNKIQYPIIIHSSKNIWAADFRELVWLDSNVCNIFNVHSHCG